MKLLAALLACGVVWGQETWYCGPPRCNESIQDLVESIKWRIHPVKTAQDQEPS